ncbi:hypothetical protein BLD44_026780 [Mastigocladus laminosus UU774]|nr:hypothetical protein BLD44_026780 [Mastigocladus laminosus UU774]
MEILPREVIIWLLFTVVVSIIPLIFDYCAKIITTQQRPKSKDFLCDGQLLLISVAFGAESMGNVLFTGKLYETWQIIIIGACFLTTLCAGILYPFIVNTRQNSTMKDPEFVVRITVILFLCSLGTSLVCKWLSSQVSSN